MSEQRVRRAMMRRCLLIAALLGACAPAEDELAGDGATSIAGDGGSADADGVAAHDSGDGVGTTSDAGRGAGDGGATGSRDTGTAGMSSDGGAPMRSDGGGTAGAGDASMGGSPAPAAASAEDEGADCPVGALPEANALPMIAKLPDPFTKLDGTRMTSKSEWRCRRQEIKRLAEKFGYYGSKPPKPAMVSGMLTDSSIMVRVSDNGKSAMFSASVKLPSGGTRPYPAVIVYGGGGFGAPLDSAVLSSEGIATISYDPYSVGREGTPRNNKQGAFYTIAGNNSTTGLLVAWAWGVSRIIDVIEQSGGAVLKADALAVTGCSRFGKGSFFAGVFDQRVALTMPIESGSAGVPIWRGIPGEGAQSLSSAYGEQPWLGDAFGAFTSKPSSLPFDTHEMVAMVAPRGLFIMDNPHIANLGPRSASVAALAGAEVYKALGAGDNITYHSDVQNGAHCAVRPEWSTPLRNSIQKFLKKSGGAAGVIKMSSKAAGNLADWREWQTPTLQ